MTAASDKPLLLIACDEPLVRNLLRDMLACGYRALEAVDGMEALARIEREGFDLALLKLDLSGISGLDIISRAREGGFKLRLIVLSNGLEKRRVAEAVAPGANDYLLSPFPSGEVLERIAAYIRQPMGEICSVAFLDGSELTVDLARRLATLRGEALKLTPKEYSILRVLVAQGGKLLPSGFIVQEVWGLGGEVQNLRTYIRKLREKIEPDPRHPSRIITEIGIGYRLLTR